MDLGEQCDTIPPLLNPDRLRALRRLGLLDSPIDPSFERLTRLTAQILGAPVALITLLDSDRQFFKSALGLPEPWASARETPLSHSFCQHVVNSDAPVLINDAPNHPHFHESPAVTELGVVAYAGVPLHTREGHTLGALCVIDRNPRDWAPAEVALLHDLGAAVETEIALCEALISRAQSARYLEAQRLAFEAMAAGQPLTEVLTILAKGVEHVIDDGYCTVMLLDQASKRLYTAAAPSVPVDFSRALDGTPIGPRQGSCGTAAFTGEPVIVPDVHLDERWAPWRGLAQSHGLRACWSLPVRDGSGTIIGTFAIYYAGPRAPSPDELERVAEAANVVALAVERWRTLDQLRASEARLRRSEANLSALFEHTEDSVLAVDRELRLTSFNRRAAEGHRRRYGVSLVAGMSIQELLPPDELQIFCAYAAAAFAGETQRREVLIETDEAERWLEIAFVPLGVPGEISGLALFARDMTARRRAEAERLEIERSWQETQRLESLGVLAGGIAHDFNNLLAVILGNADLALDDAPPGSPIVESLRQISQAARHGAGLTQQILTYAGKNRMQFAPLDLNSLIVEIASLLKSALPQRTPIRYHLAAKLPLVSGDTSQLQQVVMNLIINAAEAIGEMPGSIVVSTGQRELNPEEASGLNLPAGQYLQLQVADTGPGMDEATLARIFEPFFTTKFTGRGLGLATVQGIVRGHGGALEVSSARGKGATFTVLLPISG